MHVPRAAARIVNVRPRPIICRDHEEFVSFVCCCIHLYESQSKYAHCGQIRTISTILAIKPMRKTTVGNAVWRRYA
jgi:hypothetical protein